jgi:hypothetical protein
MINYLITQNFRKQYLINHNFNFSGSQTHDLIASHRMLIITQFVLMFGVMLILPIPCYLYCYD